MKLWTVLATNWARDRARRGGISFDLTSDDVADAIREAGGRCTYCGTKLNFSGTMSTRVKSPSIDRIVPHFSYRRENIVIACYRCNALKSDAVPSELATIARVTRRLIRRRNLRTTML